MSDFFFVFFFLERTRPAASMRAPCLIYLSTSNGILYRQICQETGLLGRVKAVVGLSIPVLV